MKQDNNDRFGIGVMRYCRAHEAEIEDDLAKGCDPRDILSWHLEKLRWIQHERLIHLLVLMLTSALFLLLICLELFCCALRILPMIFLLLLVTGLLAAYIIHYFRLENTVQHWYRLADELKAKISGIEK